MGIAEDWSVFMADLTCLSKQVAKKKKKKSINYAWGGLCAYSRCNRATTFALLKPKSKGGSSLRSNLIPACRECNHDKGSQPWLVWFQQQEFYNETAKELIEEWVTNKRFIEEELDEHAVISRAEVRLEQSTVRSITDEPPSLGENCLATA